jgi:hypothetical protein
MTIDEIKKEMTDAYVTDEAVRTAYGLQPGQTFQEGFAKVSIESLIFYIVAVAHATLRFLFESFKTEVENRIKAAVPGTIAWYHNLVMSWQYNEQNIIKYCSVSEQFPFLRIKVNTEGHGVIAQESDEMVALRSYLARNKFAGTQIRLTSEPPELITIDMKVWLSAARYTSDGNLIGTDERPVEDAIKNYLAGILYSGTFYKSKLVDAVQAVEGVSDVELLSVKVNGNEMTGATYQSQTGAFRADFENGESQEQQIKQGIEYVLC